MCREHAPSSGTSWRLSSHRTCEIAPDRRRASPSPRRTAIHTMLVMRFVSARSMMGTAGLSRQKGACVLDYIERLRRLAINDARIADDHGDGLGSGELDPKTLALGPPGRVGRRRWRGPVLRRAGRRGGERGGDGRRDRRRAGRRPSRSSGFPAWSRRPRSWRWRSATTPTTSNPNSPGDACLAAEETSRGRSLHGFVTR